MEKIPFTIIGEHLMKIPVKVNGKDVKFLFDTGIGPTVISKKFADELTLEKVGTMTGKRMSGQEMEIQLVKVPLIEAGALARKNIEVGIFDTSGMPEALKDIKGILSIGFFKGNILTIDYSNSDLIINGAGIKDRNFGRGVRVPVEVENNGPSVSLYVRIRIPSGRVLKFEVDTGSNLLIVNSRLSDELGIKHTDPEVETVTGIDETGHHYERYYAEVKGEVSIDGNPDIKQENPGAIFQDIIYDGLLGHDFLKRYIVSFDIEKKEMVFYRHLN